MIDLLAITNSPETAARLDAIPGVRVFVDLERNGKAERQQGRNTFISTHTVEDIGLVKAALTAAKLMVRVNPYQAENEAACDAEISAVLAQGADMLMLPMFRQASELQAFARLVNGRAPIVALLETRGALESLQNWIATPGLVEVFVGLPLALLMDRVLLFLVSLGYQFDICLLWYHWIWYYSAWLVKQLQRNKPDGIIPLINCPRMLF